MTRLKSFSKTKWTAVLLSCALAAGVTLQCFNVKNVYAADLVLRGDTVGLSITPENEDLFDVNNMLPGESVKSSIQISNTDNFPFTLSVEIVGGLIELDLGEKDMLDMLDIDVSMGGAVIASFPVKGGDYTIGRFIPGQTASLEVEITFNKEADNDYQGKSAKLQWIFTAVSEYTELVVTPPLPGGGGGGGGGDMLFLTVEPPPDIVPPEIASTSEYVIIPPVEIPLGAIDEPEDEEAFTELIDEEIPLGVEEMPQTGVMSLLYNIIVGAVVFGIGIMLIVKTKRRKRQ